MTERDQLVTINFLIFKNEHLIGDPNCPTNNWLNFLAESSDYSQIHIKFID